MKAQPSRPTYSLESTGGSSHSLKKEQNLRKSHRRRSSDDADPNDGNASLTYSAASSVNSGGSAAGESTDSSFADIMRVLDLQDSGELKEFIRREGVSSVSELRSRRGLTSGQSVASSLAYSADGESQLEGTKLLETITGQSSDGFGYDGASLGRIDEPIEEDSGLLFAPAEHGRIRKKKHKKSEKSPASGTRSLESSGDSSFSNSTPQSKRSSSRSHRDASPSPSVDTPTKSPPAEKSTPPPRPKSKRRFHVEDAEADDEIWYAKWWMFCFPDAAKNLMPKR